ncbi:MAG: helix-turn-helix transcriptional regulator [Bacteroidales bacterium]|nr:helix-turn-helix transcriptional regulator [Bacteroidales bacterium]MBQ9312584.1 helix-turn-helix transcriptional regulator [Bacteroidales bacterium]
MKNRLKVERAELNISQEELGLMTGVTKQTINAIENGKYAPSGLVLMKIARLCNKDVKDIFFLEDSDWTEHELEHQKKILEKKNAL